MSSIDIHKNGPNLIHLKYFSDPSIEGDTPFKSTNSIDELFCQEVSNKMKTSVTYDIRKQTHYDVWHDVEAIYKSLRL